METFVVRVWQPAEGGASEESESILRGVLEHVGSGDSDHFQGEEQLVELIRAGLARSRNETKREEVAT